MKLSQLVLLLLQCFVIESANATKYNNSQCPRKCGNVKIPYPFGTEEGCYLDKSYYIQCDPEAQVPYLNYAFSRDVNESSTTSLTVVEIMTNGSLVVHLPVVEACYDKLGRLVYGSPKSYYTSRFPISSTMNYLVGLGPNIEAHVVVDEFSVTTTCKTGDAGTTLSCDIFGDGCCRAGFPQGTTHANIVVRRAKNRTKVRDDDACGYAFIVGKNLVDMNGVAFPVFVKLARFFPVVLEWYVGNTTCEEAREDTDTFMCQDNSICVNGGDKVHGYRCECAEGYMGNAYIENGCQGHYTNDRSEAISSKVLMMQLKGNDIYMYLLSIKGDALDARSIDRLFKKVRLKIFNAGIGEGVACATLIIIFMYCGIMRRKKLKVRKDFFKQNGGIMLQEILFSCKDASKSIKIFTEEELKKATDDFNNATIIGQGGYGTVYKGILTNKTLVAIKKSKVIDQSQVKQFVNEVIILSKICHPNIVKLLGCCLETQVPMLVYEYVSNNTLCHHIHTHPTLTLEQRLKISEDTAEALSYLHSTIQIVHRDVKPSNILLDYDFNAKVSDFGISTFVPPDQTHLSTFVKGTIGYVDPEYFRTSKLTEKSDVYSFGVILMELLMGRDIHSLGISLTEYTCVATYLVSQLEQNALVQILDEQLKYKEYTEVVKCVAKLAISCLDLEGKTRPRMEEIKQELKELRCLLLSHQN